MQLIFLQLWFDMQKVSNGVEQLKYASKADKMIGIVEMEYEYGK